MIAILSDIHGNYEALKAVLGVLDSFKIKQLYCLGDIVGYYSQVNECCNELRNRNVKCVMGNHDWYMVSGTKCLRSRSVNDCLEFQRNQDYNKFSFYFDKYIEYEYAQKQIFFRL